MKYLNFRRHLWVIFTLYIEFICQPILAMNCAQFVTEKVNPYLMLKNNKEEIPNELKVAISKLLKNDYSSMELFSDSKLNLILVSPKALFLLFTPDGKVLLGSLVGPLESGKIGSSYFRFKGEKEGWNVGKGLLSKEKLLDMILLAKANELEFDLTHNTQLVDLHALAKKQTVGNNNKIDPSLPIEVLDSGRISHLDVNWLSYDGKELNIIFNRSNGDQINTRQRIDSDSKIKSRDFDLYQNLQKLVETKNVSDVRTKSEVGIWIFRVGKRVFASETFTSGQFKQLSIQHGLQKLVDLMNYMRGIVSPDVEINELILAHSHPVKGAPLSPGDISALEDIHKTLPIGSKFTIIAYSGNIVFSASRESKEQ